MRTENRANQAIRKNDLVQVVFGRETGKTGKVMEILPKKNRVVVEKVNLVKKHQKPTSQQRQGGIIEKEASMHLSNVLLVCTKCNRPVRVKMKQGKGKEVQRICIKCEQVIENKS